tara:strand:+ start:152313 stop:153023 length:711 start_codon:yes stop_codon:yes gene_type:complete
MNLKFKHVVKLITPPILLDVLKLAKRKKVRVGNAQVLSGEKGADWYDSTFDENTKWKVHYSSSDYYFLWTVIVDRMLHLGVSSVLEVGCGSGQLACLLRDRGIENYHGFDFSTKRLEQAQLVCPEYSFSVEDAFETNLLEKVDYDAVLSTEFLEHVEGDIEILRRIKPGTHFFGTVPNFPSASHVRHFHNETEVIARYEQCFEELKVDTILANGIGKKFFLMGGVIKGRASELGGE